ncbi:mutS protein homolog 4-like isoform X2 [Oratosquilla oratoria]
MAVIKHLAAPHCAYIEQQVASKYYCLAAAAALMKYIEYAHHVKYAAGSLHIDLQTLENSVIIDIGSIHKLELVSSTNGRWEESLFGTLHHTRTRGGTRLLRAMLLQPPANKDIIEARLEALQYVASHQDLFHTLQSILGRFPDLDWLLAMSIQVPKEETEVRCEQHLSHVLALKNTLELVSPLVNALSTAENTLLSSFHKEMNAPSLKVLLETLRGVLHEDARLTKGTAAMRNQCCFAIKPHINDLLDIARKIYSEIVDDITDYVEELCKEYNLELQVGYSTSLGFHIVVPVGKKAGFPQLPPVFIQRQHIKKGFTCTTELLYQLDQRSRETVKEILLMSNVIVMEVMQEVRQCLGVLCALSETVSNLDVIVALAHASSLRNWVKPELGNTIAIRKGRHPILDQLSSIPPVANNTFINEEHRVLMVTGPNMSGKSTYLRQIALLHILAQIGCFIPADYGCIRIVNQIFTHLGSDDSPESNTSTFQLQMIDINYMLSCVGPEALMVLDEIGSATSIEEGGAIAWAVIEYLIQARPVVIIATHIIFLTNMSKLYPQVINYCMDSENQENNGRLHLTHVVRRGVTKAQHYGLALAKVTTFPQRILSRASDLLQTLPSTQVQVTMNKSQKKEQTIYHLASELISLATALFPTSSSNCTISALQLPHISLSSSSHEPEPVSSNQTKNLSVSTFSDILASSSATSSVNRDIGNSEGVKGSLVADAAHSRSDTGSRYVETFDVIENGEKEQREMGNMEGFGKEVELEDKTVTLLKEHLQAMVKNFLKHSDKS